MSNLIKLDAVKITNTKNKTAFGFILQDDYLQEVFITDKPLTMFDHFQILSFTAQNLKDSGTTILKALKENEDGIMIDECFYEFDEIKHLLKDIK